AQVLTERGGPVRSMASPPSSTEERLITGEELARMGDIGRCELIDGRIIRMSPTNRRHGRVEFRGHRRLRPPAPPGDGPHRRSGTVHAATPRPGARGGRAVPHVRDRDALLPRTGL